VCCRLNLLFGCTSSGIAREGCPSKLEVVISKKNETPLFATVFVVLSILLHVSAYIGHLQELRIQNVKRTAVMQY
jgi:hypothetical protein